MVSRRQFTSGLAALLVGSAFLPRKRYPNFTDFMSDPKSNGQDYIDGLMIKEYGYVPAVNKLVYDHDGSLWKADFIQRVDSAFSNPDWVKRYEVTIQDDNFAAGVAREYFPIETMLMTPEQVRAFLKSENTRQRVILKAKEEALKVTESSVVSKQGSSRPDDETGKKTRRSSLFIFGSVAKNGFYDTGSQFVSYPPTEAGVRSTLRHEVCHANDMYKPIILNGQNVDMFDIINVSAIIEPRAYARDLDFLRPFNKKSGDPRERYFGEYVSMCFSVEALWEMLNFDRTGMSTKESNAIQATIKNFRPYAEEAKRVIADLKS